jgi:hypothetical protein
MGVRPSPHVPASPCPMSLMDAIRLRSRVSFCERHSYRPSGALSHPPSAASWAFLVTKAMAHGHAVGMCRVPSRRQGTSASLLESCGNRLRPFRRGTGPTEALTNEIGAQELLGCSRRIGSTLKIASFGPSPPGEHASFRYAPLRVLPVVGILVGTQSENVIHRKLIVELARESCLPAIYSYRESAEDGGLMSYAMGLASAMAAQIRPSRPHTLGRVRLPPDT